MEVFDALKGNYDRVVSQQSTSHKNNKKNQNQNQQQNKKSNMVCDFCNRTNHVIKDCRELKYYQQGRRRKRDGGGLGEEGEMGEEKKEDPPAVGGRVVRPGVWIKSG